MGLGKSRGRRRGKQKGEYKEKGICSERTHASPEGQNPILNISGRNAGEVPR